jgi:hypothetical protein
MLKVPGRRLCEDGRIINPSIAVLYTQSPEAETLRGREMQRIKLSRGCVRDAAKSTYPLWRSVLVASSPTRRGTP